MYDDEESPGLQEIQFKIKTAADQFKAGGYTVASTQDFPIMLPGYRASKTYTCVTSIRANETCNPHKESEDNVLLFSLNASVAPVRLCSAASASATQQHTVDCVGALA